MISLYIHSFLLYIIIDFETGKRILRPKDELRYLVILIITGPIVVISAYLCLMSWRYIAFGFSRRVGVRLDPGRSIEVLTPAALSFPARPVTITPPYRAHYRIGGTVFIKTGRRTLGIPVNVLDDPEGAKDALFSMADG